MDPERWHRIEHIYHSALERQADERAAFLSEACAFDHDLLHQVQRLLEQSRSTNTLFRRSVRNLVANLEVASTLHAPGTRLGPYEILTPLGEGGMGKVYRGIDTRLGRAVAIKVSAE